jgi:adenylate cyclase
MLIDKRDAPLCSSDPGCSSGITELWARASVETDPQRRVAQLMGGISTLLGADRGTLFLFDWNTLELRTNVADGIRRNLVVPLHMGIVGSAILRREIANVTDAYSHPYFNADIDASMGYKTRTLLVAPMLSRDGQALGGVELLNKLEGSFTRDDEVMTAAAAARIARWIDDDKIYPAGVESELLDLRNSVRCDRGSVFALEERTSRLIALYADGGDGRVISLNMKLGLAGMVAVTGTPVVIQDAWEDPRFDRSVDNRSGYRTRSMLCVPVKDRSGRTLGVVQLINRRDGPFSSDDLLTLQAFSQLLGHVLADTYKQDTGQPAPGAFPKAGQ